jgi:hypothetical protein
MGVVLLKLVIVAVCSLCGVWMLRSGILAATTEAAFLRRIIGVQLATSLGWFIALYVIGGHEVTSDVPGYYLPPAHAVLAGQLPYRDFALSYAPLFPYVAAALVSIWDSGKVFVLFDIVLNTVTLLLWHATVRGTCGRLTARHSSILYASSGHVLVQGLLGTNQAWIAVALAGSALLMAGGRGVAAGVLQGISSGATKILALVFWPALWLCCPQRSRWLWGAALAALTVYGCCAFLGADPLDAVWREADAISSGNLPYLGSLLFGSNSTVARRVFDSMALAVLGITSIWLYLQVRALPASARPKLLYAALALTACVFMLFSKKSFTGYAVFAMYPIAVVLTSSVAGQRMRVVFVLAFNALLAAEPSVWFHLGGPHQDLSAWLSGRARLAAIGFLWLDGALLACYAFVAYLSVRCARWIVAGAMESSRLSQDATACSLV